MPTTYIATIALTYAGVTAMGGLALLVARTFGWNLGANVNESQIQTAGHANV